MAHCAVDIWAKLTFGNLPFNELKACFRLLPESTMNACMLLQAEGIWHQFHGRTQESVEVLEKAWSLARSNFVSNLYTVPAMVWLATALRLHAENVKPQKGRALRKRALKFARWSYRFGRLFPADKPHALREISLIFAANGRTRRALKYAERSCAVADKQKAKYEYARSSLLCLQLRNKLGIDGAAAQIEEAERALARFQSMIDAAASDVFTNRAALAGK